MKVILKVNLDFSQYREIRICSCTAENELIFENIRNYQKSFMGSVFQLKLIPQKFLFAFPSIFFKKIFLARIAWLGTVRSAKNLLYWNCNFDIGST